MKNKIFKLLVLSFLSIFVLNMNWLEKSEKEQIKPVIEKKYMDIVDPPEIDNPGGPIINTIEDQSTNFTDAVIMEIGDSFQEDFQTTTDEDYYVYESTTATCIKFYFTRVATASYDFNVVVYRNTSTGTLKQLFEYQVLNPHTDDIEQTVMTKANYSYYFKVTKISNSNSTNSGDTASPNTTIMPSYYVHLVEITNYNIVRYDYVKKTTSVLNFYSNGTENIRTLAGNNVMDNNLISHIEAYEEVANVMIPPYRSNCMVTDERGVGFCSGVIVGPNLLLTAAHCVYKYNERSFQQETLVNPAYYSGSRPFGEFTAEYAYIHKNYYFTTENQRYYYDWAILELNGNVGFETGWSAIISNFIPSNAEQSSIYIVGYPNNLSYRLFRSYGMLLAIEQNRYLYSNITYYGMSGGPIYAEISGVNYIIGIHTTGFDDYDAGIKINAMILNFIESLK